MPAQLKTVRVNQWWRVAKVDLLGDPGGRVDAEELPRVRLRHDEHAALGDDPIEVSTFGLREVAGDRQQRRCVLRWQRPVRRQWDLYKLRFELVSHVHRVMCDRYVVEGPDFPRREEGREQGAAGRVVDPHITDTRAESGSATRNPQPIPARLIGDADRHPPLTLIAGLRKHSSRSRADVAAPDRAINEGADENRRASAALNALREEPIGQVYAVREVVMRCGRGWPRSENESKDSNE